MKLIRRIFIAIIGGTVLLIGIAMIALPGPAIIVIPAGLGILAIEFAWAARWLQKAKEYMPGKKNQKVVSSAPSTTPAEPDPVLKD